MKAPVIWKKLLIDGRRIATTDEIRALAKEIGKSEWRSLKYLQTHGYIVRILRGIFYVRSIEERENRSYDISIYEMVAMALREKGVKKWYYGLETGLKLNLMTHEYYMIDYVLTDSFRTTKVIDIANHKFKFIRRGKKHFKDGIIREKKICYSDPEKTVLDLAYRDYLKKKDHDLYMNTLMEYRNRIDRDRALELLGPFPKAFRKMVGEHL